MPLDFSSIAQSALQSASGGLVGMGVSALGSLFGKSASDKAYEHQLEMQRRDQQFSEKMWNLNNQYNSPSNQAKLMMQGGFNPAALYGQNGSSVAQASQPSAGSHSGSPAITELESNPFVGFSSVAQAMQSLSQSQKNIAEIPGISAHIKEMLSKASLNDSERSLNNYRLKLEQTYGPALKSAEIAERLSHHINLLAQADLFANMGDTEKAKQALMDAQKELAKANTKLTDAQRSIVEIDAKYEEQRVLATIDEQKASAQEKRAAASEHSANASLTRYTESMQRALESNNIDKALSEAQTAYNESLISGWQVEAAKASAEQAKVAASHAEAQFWKDFALDIVKGGVDAYANIRSAGAWSAMSKAQQKNAETKVKELEKRYSPKSSQNWKVDKKGRKYYVSGTDHYSR